MIKLTFLLLSILIILIIAIVTISYLTKLYDIKETIEAIVILFTIISVLLIGYQVDIKKQDDLNSVLDTVDNLKNEIDLNLMIINEFEKENYSEGDGTKIFYLRLEKLVLEDAIQFERIRNTTLKKQLIIMYNSINQINKRMDTANSPEYFTAISVSYPTSWKEIRKEEINKIYENLKDTKKRIEDNLIYVNNYRTCVENYKDYRNC
ncbi:MAG: hypothetical protein ABIG20_00450 [archaeon]